MPSAEESMTYMYGSSTPLALVRRAAELVRRYSYKPTITMEVTSGGFEPILHMQMLVADSRRIPSPSSNRRKDERGFYPTIFGEGGNYYDDYGSMVRNGSIHSRSLNPDDRPVVPVAAKWPIPGDLLTIGGEDDFERWLFHKIVDLEMHEAREWFRRDGEIVDDPHNPTGRLA